MVQILNIENLEAWNKFRGTGIGASEVGALLNLNSFRSRIELFYDKVGFKPKPFINLLMLGGKMSEAFTSSIFEAYNGGSVEETAQNIEAKKFYRTCKKLPLHSFVQNSDWLHTYASPDREFADPQRGIESGSLEIKDVGAFALANYKDGINPNHVVQLKVQMAVWAKENGALSYLVDRGRDYKEFHFENDGIIFNNKYTGEIVLESDLKTIIKDFWSAVVIAREATHKMKQCELDFNLGKAQEYQNIIHQCEPAPDASLAYEDFVKDNFYFNKRPVIEITGNGEHEILAEEYLKSKERLDVAKSDFQLNKNKVLNICKSGNKVILPNKGYLEVIDNKGRITIKVKN